MEAASPSQSVHTFLWDKAIAELETGHGLRRKGKEFLLGQGTQNIIPILGKPPLSDIISRNITPCTSHLHSLHHVTCPSLLSPCAEQIWCCSFLSRFLFDGRVGALEVETEETGQGRRGSRWDRAGMEDLWGSSTCPFSAVLGLTHTSHHHKISVPACLTAGRITSHV